MAQYPAVIELSDIDGFNGFQINGEAADDLSGFSVASAGDVNGDGISDLIIGAPFASGNNYSGASYVVFGKTTPFAANLNLSALTGGDGFQISGEAAGDRSGRSVASAGDVNGDGFDDLIVGAPSAGANGIGSGASYVVFGKGTPFAANLNLSALSGADGFQISGETSDDRSGFSVASAGDINGDGFADLIVGAYAADPNGAYSGASYVVFGKATPFAANLNLSALTGGNGFRIIGETINDLSGRSVAAAGDVNGDGIDDLIIGAFGADPNDFSSGASHVVFGKTTPFAAELDLGDLDGGNGFQISGEAATDFSGASVASAGDVNGDGFADLIVGAYGADPNGAYSGASYVVFGAAGFAATLNLSALTGGNGFKISGEAANDLSGYTVASAGDVNGDGFADLLVAARSAVTNGNGSGASYVVFGKATPFAAELDLADLDGDNGFQISGEAAYDQSGRSVAAAGDVNGDGFDDLIVGAPLADPNGNSSGVSYVVFGREDTDPVNLTGTAIGNRILGGTDGDTIDGLGGNDVLFGRGGDDTLNGGGDNDRLDGGAGADTMNGGDGNDIYYVDNVGDVLIDSAGSDRLFASADYTLADGVAVERMFVVGPAGLNLTGNRSANIIVGGEGDDRLSGGRGNDTLTGGGGRDRLDGGVGADTMDGGLGNDTYYVDNAGDTIVDSAGTDRLFASADYTLANGVAVERLFALGPGGVSLTGNRSANLIVGAAGDDTLAGGIGLDTMTGGGGEDIFLFDTRIAAGNVDTIDDFSVADDTIHLDNAIFVNLGADGALNPRAFVIGAPQDANDRLLYNSTTGALSYDGDGSGAKAAVQFAQLGAGLALTSQDFLIV